VDSSCTHTHTFTYIKFNDIDETQGSGLSSSLRSIGSKKDVSIVTGGNVEDIVKTMKSVREELIETKKSVDLLLKDGERVREKREKVKKIKTQARETASRLIQTETQKRIVEIDESFRIRKAALKKKLEDIS
jgi:hypothetical protein